MADDLNLAKDAQKVLFKMSYADCVEKKGPAVFMYPGSKSLRPAPSPPALTALNAVAGMKPPSLMGTSYLFPVRLSMTVRDPSPPPGARRIFGSAAAPPVACFFFFFGLIAYVFVRVIFAFYDGVLDSVFRVWHHRERICLKIGGGEGGGRGWGGREGANVGKGREGEKVGEMIILFLPTAL